MQLPVDIVDHIFSFLVSHHKTLVVCARDPVLSPIVERHLYYHVTVGVNGFVGAISPDQLSKLVSENPRILNHVRILQIHYPEHDGHLTDFFDMCANTLLMFPALESIKLTTPESRPRWYWYSSFRTALEDRLNLPTLKEIHLVGGDDFPSSLLDKCKGIKNISLSGRFDFCDLDSTPPQLETLTLCTDSVSSLLLAWLSLRTNELQSLRWSLLSGIYPLSTLLGVCSESLNKLDLDFADSPYSTTSTHKVALTVETNPLPELFPLPPNLQKLTIRTAIDLFYDDDECYPEQCNSWLPAAAETINLFSSSLQHLVLDINIRPRTSRFLLSHLNRIDFSPLAVLGPASLSIPRIDLLFRVGTDVSGVLRDQFVSSLQRGEDILGMVKKGVLIIRVDSSWCLEELGLQ